MEILKNKLFIISSLFLLLILGMSTSSFASINVTYNETEYEFPDPPIVEGHTNFVIYPTGFTSGAEFRLVFMPDTMTSTQDFFDFKYNTSTPSDVYPYWSTKTGCKVSIYDFDGDNNEWVFYMANTNCNVKKIIYTTVDFYDAEGNVLFQKAPQVVIPEITKTLVEQTTQVGMKPLTQIKTLLPIVIVTIVGLIGFWKAWQLLSKQLKRA